MKLICPWVMCQYNSSHTSDKSGECRKAGEVRLEVAKNHLDSELTCGSYTYSELKEKLISGGQEDEN